jgi:hypothetical protein
MVPETPAQRSRVAAFSAKIQMLRREDCQNENCWRLVSKPVFQEVKVATMLPGVVNWAAEVSLPRGLAVRFSQTAPVEWIGSVVQALQRPC